MIVNIYFEYQGWRKKTVPMLRQGEITKQLKEINLTSLEKDIGNLYYMPKVISVNIGDIIYTRDELLNKTIRLVRRRDDDRPILSGRIH